MEDDVIAYCWATGLIEFNQTVPPGAQSIAKGKAKILREIISVAARHAKDSEALLVPGVPEAKSFREKREALEKWKDWLIKCNYKDVIIQ